MKLELKHLLQIEAIAKHRHFGKAAKELNISQPGLSQSIRQLEDQLGIKLFERNSREIELTPFGEHTLHLGKPILEDSKNLDRSLAKMIRQKNGEIRAGFGPLAAEILLKNTLNNLEGEELVSTTILVDNPAVLIDYLHSGDLDVIVCDSRFLSSKMKYTMLDLPSYPAVFICRPDHPLTSSPRAKFSDIFDYPFAGPPLPKEVKATIDMHTGHSFTDKGILPKGSIELPFHLIPDIVLSSDAVGLSIEELLIEQIKRGDLHKLSFGEPTFSSSYKVITLQRHPPFPHLEKFQKSIIKTARALADCSLQPAENF